MNSRFGVVIKKASRSQSTACGRWCSAPSGIPTVTRCTSPPVRKTRPTACSARSRPPPEAPESGLHPKRFLNSCANYGSLVGRDQKPAQRLRERLGSRPRRSSSTSAKPPPEPRRTTQNPCCSCTLAMPQLGRELSLLRRFGQIDGNSPAIRADFDPNGFSSSSPTTPATQCSLGAVISGCAHEPEAHGLHRRG